MLRIESGCRLVEWCADSSLLAVCGEALTIWKRNDSYDDTGLIQFSPLFSQPLPSPAVSLSISSNNRFLAVATEENPIVTVGSFNLLNRRFGMSRKIGLRSI